MYDELNQWQYSLATLVARGASRIDKNPVAALPVAQQEWFGKLRCSAGIRLMRKLQRSWCLARANECVPLTLSVIGDRLGIVEAWVTQGGGTASFQEREEIAFLDFIASSLDPDSHAYSVCMFERAVRWAERNGARDRSPAEEVEKLVILYKSDRSRQAGLSKGCSLVRFWAEPGKVLHAAVTGGALPAREIYPSWLLVGPQLEGLWRTVTPREAILLGDGQVDIAPSDDHLVAALIREGAWRLEVPIMAG
jgi:hypothetical protein